MKNFALSLSISDHVRTMSRLEIRRYYKGNVSSHRRVYCCISPGQCFVATLRLMFLDSEGN